MRVSAVQILGIVNVTRDSFSDGGRFLDPAAALEHARRLLADGAAIVDLGAESTHPDAEDVPANEQIARLTPLIEALKRAGMRVSVDTHRAEVMQAVLNLGCDMINDVTALRDPETAAVLRDHDVPVILMHSTAQAARAQRRDIDPETIVARIVGFFEQRLASLEAVGIARERLILDPGMGFFLGRRADVSLAVLHGLERLRALGRPLCVSTSRKSFIGNVLGTADRPRPVAERGAGTLATELWAAQQGVTYIRTHDVRALHDAITVWQAIAQAAASR